VIIVTQSFAENFYPGEDPLGKPILPGISFGLSEDVPRTVVGVVGDARYRALAEAPEPTFYVPQGQSGIDLITVHFRATPGMSPMVSIRNIVKEMDPNLPLRNVEEMTAAIDRALGPARFNLLLLATFAGLAVILAAVGLYGVVSYLVSQRTREIAVRLAMGAKQETVIRMVLGQGIRPAAVGIVLGLGGAFAGSRLIKALLFGIEATDFVSYLAATAILVIVVILATLIPALRASRIAPMVALRQE
jgi:putative ABC transport system permease protein